MSICSGTNDTNFLTIGIDPKWTGGKKQVLKILRRSQICGVGDMIDAKLNELVPETEGTKSGKKVEGGNRTGLSIKDTVAGPANLSVGARGVETSGTSSGAGVGAGMTYTSATTAGESPSPAILPGERGSGTTVRGASNKAAPAEAMPS